MIKQINHANKQVAQAIQSIQRPAYRMEAELMGFDGIPQLAETVEEIQQSDETFIGFQDEFLKGFLSFKKEEKVVDIYRLVVDPLYFRRGIARRLLEHLLEQNDSVEVTVSTGTANMPARRLYQSFGFQEEETFEVAPGVTCTQYRLLRK